jgi:hypothetical protein
LENALVESLKVEILGPDWPGRQLPLMPGDLTQFLPQGLALGTPAIVRPWDDPLKVLTGPSFYGVDPPESHPFRAAPTQEPSGGAIYFDDHLELGEIRAALEVMGAILQRNDYVVFAASANDPPNDRYLDQVRILPRAALAHFFGCGEASALPDQPIPIGDFIAQFINDQRAKWNDPSYAFSGRLAGTLGGDGDWAKESLCFGFLVENTYWSVYRLWSRAWLVTK